MEPCGSGGAHLRRRGAAVAEASGKLEHAEELLRYPTAEVPVEVLAEMEWYISHPLLQDAQVLRGGAPTTYQWRLRSLSLRTAEVERQKTTKIYIIDIMNSLSLSILRFHGLLAKVARHKGWVQDTEVDSFCLVTCGEGGLISFRP